MFIGYYPISFFWLLLVILEHHGLCASSSYLIFIMRTTHFLCLFLIFFLFVFIRVGLRFCVRDGMGLSFTISFFFWDWDIYYLLREGIGRF